MAEMSRRTFLVRGSLGAAAAAVASALPNLPALASTATEEAPAEDDAATLAAEALPSTTDPLIAHVTDLRTGQLSVFVGEREFAVVDRSLASRLFQVTK